MKLSKENIGQKFTVKHWGGDYFLLLAICSNGDVVGETDFGSAISFSKEQVQLFEPYMEPQPKQEVLMSPSIDTGYMDGNIRRLPMLAGLQFDEPLRVVFKNMYVAGVKMQDPVEAELWIKVKE